MLVQKGVFDKFSAMVTAAVQQKLVCADGFDRKSTLGPLIDRRALEKALTDCLSQSLSNVDVQVSKHVKDCVSKGAVVRTGGRECEALNRGTEGGEALGSFFEPTVLTGLTVEMVRQQSQSKQLFARSIFTNILCSFLSMKKLSDLCFRCCASRPNRRPSHWLTTPRETADSADLIDLIVSVCLSAVGLDWRHMPAPETWPGNIACPFEFVTFSHGYVGISVCLSAGLGEWPSSWTRAWWASTRAP